MGLRWTDSFLHYATLDQKYDDVQNTGTFTGGANQLILSGGKMVQQGSPGSGTSGRCCAFVYFPDAPSTIFVGMRIMPTAWEVFTDNRSHSCGRFLSFWDGGQEQLGISMIFGGQLAVYRQSTLLGTFTTNSLQLNVPQYLTFKVKIDGSTGTVDIQDGLGVSWLSLSGQNTRGGTTNNYMTSVAVGFDNPLDFADSGAFVAAFTIQDLIMFDTTGTAQNNFMGDRVIAMRLPGGNGTQDDFTRGGSIINANNYQQVNENPPDGDVTYNFSSTVTNQDRFVIAAVAATTVNGVAMYCYNEQTDGGVRAMRFVAKLGGGGTLADSGTDLLIPRTYHYNKAYFDLDPDGNAWTQSTVSAMEFGYKLTQ